MRALATLFTLLLSLWTMPARADELRPGYLELSEQSAGLWQMNWKQPVNVAPTRMPPAPHLSGSCQFVGEPDVGAAGGAIIGTVKLRCTGPIGGQTIEMPGMLGQSDMLVRIQPLDEPAQALRLTAQEPSAIIQAKPDSWQVLRTYFVLGVEHILAGWDHLLFVIALVLLIRNWKSVALAATAFTAAHSITLAAAALGFVGIAQKPVEALIALSIVFLALEIVRSRIGTSTEAGTLTQQYPWVVAFLFGLLHGFGFAGALNSIGLPEGDVVTALLAFNVGVEAGQLLVVAAILAALAVLRTKFVSAMEPAIKFSAYAIGITGAYWLVERVVT